jgi:hypothetical protein
MITIIVITWIALIPGNILLGKWQVSLVRKAINKGVAKAILHGFWAAAYAGVCAIPVIIYHVAWNKAAILMISFAGIHASIFPIAFNWFDGNPAFNLSKTSTSIIDKIQVRLRFKTSFPFNFISFVISILLLILFIHKT